jgi:hypothetical protein
MQPGQTLMTDANGPAPGLPVSEIGTSDSATVMGRIVMSSPVRRVPFAASHSPATKERNEGHEEPDAERYVIDPCGRNSQNNPVSSTRRSSLQRRASQLLSALRLTPVLRVP